MGKIKIHAICVALFLVFGHIAMIAGMLDPSILGYKGTSSHEITHGSGGHEYCDLRDHENMMRQHHKMMPNMPSEQMPMGKQGHGH
jgi:hypothetical protein